MAYRGDYIYIYIYNISPKRSYLGLLLGLLAKHCQQFNRRVKVEKVERTAWLVGWRDLVLAVDSSI
jgi:hypothetical protein